MVETTANLSLIQPRTCNLCRHRRVKCDRQIPQCLNCQESGASCVYPPGRGRAPKRLRPDETNQLSERLAHLESIISRLGVSAQERHRPQERSDKKGNSPVTHFFNQKFSRLKVHDTKSYYVNNALWVTLSSQVEELRDLLFEPAIEDSHCEMPTQQYPLPVSTAIPTTPSSQISLSTLIFGYRAISSSLLALHPSLAQAAALFSAFTDNVSPLVRIFHMPTLTRMYWDGISSLDMLDKDTETLFFAIYYSTVVSLAPAQCFDILHETREGALEKYRFAVEQALARGDLLSTKSITMLQACVLFLSALPNEDDSRATWSLTSLIYHIARTMGLHRDGTIFGLKPLETELRRRLWWQICIIDSRSSEYHCNEAIVRDLASDTKPPLHVNDYDLTMDMIDPPVEQWDQATDMTLSLIRCEAIQTGWELGRMNQKPHERTGGMNHPSNDDCHESVRKQKALIERLEARLRDRYLPICNSSVPLQLLSSAVARIILSRFWLTTKYLALSRMGADGKNRNTLFSGSSKGTEEPESDLRDDLFHTSVVLLEISGMLLTNKDIMQWTWYSKTHIQWGAMAFVLSELCDRSPSPGCDRAWECVTTIYEVWRVDGNHQNDKNRLALSRPIRRLMAKACYVRERQRAERLNSEQARRPGCVMHQPVAGNASQFPLSSSSSTWTPSSQHISSAVTPESTLPGRSTVQSNQQTQDELWNVLGTESLGPFMNLLPDWSWAISYETNPSSSNGVPCGIASVFHPDT